MGGSIYSKTQVSDFSLIRSRLKAHYYYFNELFCNYQLSCKINIKTKVQFRVMCNINDLRSNLFLNLLFMDVLYLISHASSQSFDKQGFHTGTPPPFNLPSALGGTGPLNPGGAPGYAPAPFLHILPPHQQPHSQLLHHHLTQDGQVNLRLYIQDKMSQNQIFGSWYQ